MALKDFYHLQQKLAKSMNCLFRKKFGHFFPSLAEHGDIDDFTRNSSKPTTGIVRLCKGHILKLEVFLHKSYNCKND